MTSRKYDGNGWFEVDSNPISQVGIFPYSGAQLGRENEPDRIFNVYRPAEELSSPETMDSFRLVPVIDDHVMLGEGAKPAEDKGIEGVIGDKVTFDGNTLRANIKIMSKRLAQKIKAGKTQLSLGYRAVYDFTPGVYNGQRYDAVQRRLRGNHIALVENGRMGAGVRVLDAMDHMIFTVEQETTDVEDEVKKAIAAFDEALKSSTAALDTAVANLPALVAKAVADSIADIKAAAAKPVTDADPDDDATVTAEAMDAALKKITTLEATVAALSARPAMDEAAITTTLATKHSLVSRLSTHIGTFDAAVMTVADVAKYGIEKLGITGVAVGHELAALDAFLQAKPKPAPAVIVQDGALSAGGAVAAYLNPAPAA